MKVINGITYLEEGEKHPNADRYTPRKNGKRWMLNKTTIRSGYYTKAANRREIQKHRGYENN